MRFAALLSAAAALCRMNGASAFSAITRHNTARSLQGASFSLAAAKVNDDDGDDVATDGTRRLLFAAGGFAAAATLAPTNTNAVSGPYTPAPGSMEGKVVVITGGNTGKHGWLCRSLRVNENCSTWTFVFVSYCPFVKLCKYSTVLDLLTKECKLSYLYI